MPATKNGWLAGLVLAWMAGGCAVRFEPVPRPGQTVVPGRRGIVAMQDRLTVRVEPTDVPWFDGGLVAFTIELTNRRMEGVRLARQDVLLLDEQDRIHRPVAPERLRSWFRLTAEATRSSPPARVIVVTGTVSPCGSFCWRPRYYRDRCRRYRYYDTWWRYPYYYDWPEYYVWDDAWYYEQLERKRAARFLSQLWISGLLAPREVRLGHVVFRYKPRSKEHVRLTLTVHPAPAATRPVATQAAATRLAASRLAVTTRWAPSVFRFEFAWR